MILKNRYFIGQEVFVFRDKKCQKTTINTISMGYILLRLHLLRYSCDNGHTYYESEIGETKEELKNKIFGDDNSSNQH